MKPIGSGHRAAIFLALPLFLAGCATVRATEPGEFGPVDKYVAMGSSFAAGAAIGPTKPGTPGRCGRTVNNYPSLLARKLGLSLFDETCGGAKTEHVLTSWNEIPAQIDAIDASTRLVTVTIGGNDVNYVGNLFMASCTPGEIVVAGEYEIPCVEPTPPSEEDYAKLQEGLTQIAEQVRRRAPEARLVFVQYVTLVPANSCNLVRLSDDDMSMTRTIGARLAVITRHVAAASGANLLEAGDLSRGHTACDSEPWSNAMPDTIELSNGAPWHPNAKGHAAIADELANLLRRK